MQINSLIGKKTAQNHGFLQDGTRVPLTAVNVLGNFVTQIKNTDKEGYAALQLGKDTNKKAKKRIVNHSKKAGLENTPRFLKEIRVDDTDGAILGSQINVAEVFAPGDIVDVTGTSKGKGWAGGVKRHGFSGGPRTHGQSDRERAPGSIGQTTTPGRVYKGKRMAGRMGTETVTIKNLEIIEVTNDGVLLIKGLVPGFVNGYVIVKKVGENNKFVPMYKEVVDEPVTEVEVPAEVAPEEPEQVQTEAAPAVEQPVEQTPVVVEAPAESVVEVEAVVSEEAKPEEVKEGEQDAGK